MRDVENAIAPSFEYFDFVVETFDKAAGIAIDEEIGNLIQPVFERFDEVIKASKSLFWTRLIQALNLRWAIGFLRGNSKIAVNCSRN